MPSTGVSRCLPDSNLGSRNLVANTGQLVLALKWAPLPPPIGRLVSLSPRADCSGLTVQGRKGHSEGHGPSLDRGARKAKHQQRGEGIIISYCHHCIFMSCFFKVCKYIWL